MFATGNKKRMYCIVGTGGIASYRISTFQSFRAGSVSYTHLDVYKRQILGMPVPLNGVLLNTAVVIQKGKILGVVPKTDLPNYKEFYEKRWFTSACEVSETTAPVSYTHLSVISSATVTRHVSTGIS